MNINSNGKTCEGPDPVTRKPSRQYSWGFRNWFQLGVFLITIAIGVQFFIYVEQAGSSEPITVQRPPGVEGFLPIGALMGWRLFVATGVWDPIHPAAMVILGYAGLISILLRKSFCGWFCPVGTLSEWLWKLGQKQWGRNFILPKWLDYPLRLLKYAILGFFVYVIVTMSVQAIMTFLQGSYYRLSDVKMLFFFTRMTGLTAIVLVVLTVLSFLVRNFWCRYMCPYGALMGLLALISPTGIERNEETCVDCGRCGKVCPYSLPVDTKTSIRSPECSGCLDCTLVCPVENTLVLNIKSRTRRPLSVKSIGLVVGGVFLALYFSASVTGHWQGAISDMEFRMRLENIDSPENVHP